MKKILFCLFVFLSLANKANAYFWDDDSSRSSDPFGDYKNELSKIMNHTFDGERTLSDLQKMYESFPKPTLPDLAQFNKINDSRVPPGKLGYRTSEGCIYIEQSMDDAKAQWSGEDCKNGLITGQGSLKYSFKTNGGDTNYLILEGEFLNGQLNGKGRKYIFWFAKNDKYPYKSLYYEGDFKNNYLNGQGTKAFYFKPSDNPSLMVWDGKFEDSEAAQGSKNIVSMLNPYKGVSALTMQVLFGKTGDYGYYRWQGHNNKEVTKGKIWFSQAEQTPWIIDIDELKPDFKLGLSTLKNASLNKEGSSYQVEARCANWLFESNSLKCNPKGQDQGFFRIFGLQEKMPGVAGIVPYSINAPQRSISLEESKPVYTTHFLLPSLWKDGSLPSDFDNSICDASLKRCKRTKTNLVRGNYRTVVEEIEWSGGNWRMITSRTGDSDSKGSFINIDSSCEKFSSDQETCAIGSVFTKNGRWDGGFSLIGNGAYPRTQGRGKFTFKEGRWVIGVMEVDYNSEQLESRFTDVEDCGGDRVTDCEIRNGRVHFTVRRR